MPGAEGTVSLCLVTHVTPSVAYQRNQARLASVELSRLIREVDERRRRRRPTGMAA
jgi:hypothetical protein